MWIRKKNFPRGYMNVFCQVTNGSLIYSQVIDYFTTVVTSDHFICSCILIFFFIIIILGNSSVEGKNFHFGK